MDAANIPAGYMRQGGLLVRYQLAWNPAEKTATIIRAIYAGIDGPWGEAAGVDSRDAAERFAFNNGLTPAGEWTVTGNGEHYVPLTSFK